MNKTDRVKRAIGGPPPRGNYSVRIYVGESLYREFPSAGIGNRQIIVKEPDDSGTMYLFIDLDKQDHELTVPDQRTADHIIKELLS